MPLYIPRSDERGGRAMTRPIVVFIALAVAISCAHKTPRVAPTSADKAASVQCAPPASAGADSLTARRQDSASIACRGHRYQTLRIF